MLFWLTLCCIFMYNRRIISWKMSTGYCCRLYLSLYWPTFQHQFKRCISFSAELYYSKSQGSGAVTWNYNYIIMMTVIFAHWCRLNTIDYKVIQNYNISMLTNENLVVDLCMQYNCVQWFLVYIYAH